MKRILIALLMVVSVATFVSAQKIDMMAGIQGSYIPWNITGDSSGSGSFDMSLMDFGVFVDATYVRVDIAFGFNVSDMLITSKNSSGTVEYVYTNTNISVSVFSISIVGKYPIEATKGVNLWPALGFGYDMMLSIKSKDGKIDYAKDGYGYFKFDDMSDLYLLLGLGGDIAVSDNLAIVPMLLYGLNLTPKITKEDTPASVTWSGYKFVLSLGVGYKF